MSSMSYPATLNYLITIAQHLFADRRHLTHKNRLWVLKTWHTIAKRKIYPEGTSGYRE
jgi:hypothetical protein